MIDASAKPRHDKLEHNQRPIPQEPSAAFSLSQSFIRLEALRGLGGTKGEGNESLHLFCAPSAG
jgi:hypothetical protein